MIKELGVEAGVVRDDRRKAQLPPHCLGSPAGHLSRHPPIAEQIEDPRGQGLRRAQGNQKAAPAIANDVGAAGHACRHDGQPSERGFEQHSRHAFAIFRRKREHVGEVKGAGTSDLGPIAIT